MQQVNFWHQLSSRNTSSLRRFIHVVACINSLFLFFAEWYSVVWMYHICSAIHQVQDIWVISSLGLLRIKRLCTFIYKFLSENYTPFLWDKYLRMPLLLSTVSLFLVLKGTAKYFPVYAQACKKGKCSLSERRNFTNEVFPISLNK